MQTAGHLDSVIRVNVNSFLLRGWCSDCRPESRLKIEGRNHAEVVVRVVIGHPLQARQLTQS